MDYDEAAMMEELGLFYDESWNSEDDYYDDFYYDDDDSIDF